MRGWIDTGERPTKDGYFLAYMTTGYYANLMYTVRGGWNTYVDSKGNLHMDAKLDDEDVTAWFEAPEYEGAKNE